jgi:hypothetical protein
VCEHWKETKTIFEKLLFNSFPQFDNYAVLINGNESLVKQAQDQSQKNFDAQNASQEKVFKEEKKISLYNVRIESRICPCGWLLIITRNDNKIWDFRMDVKKIISETLVV